jgi:hypothetical protein
MKLREPGQKPKPKNGPALALGSQEPHDGYAKTKSTDSAAVSGSHRK